jgi:predicted amidohydrolase YtcJ
MLHAYTHDPSGQFPDSHHGHVHVGTETLSKDLTELDARGFTVKIHAAGDGSIRACLDAIRVAREANGNKDKRHQLAHAGFVAREDIPKFAELNAVADLSPYIWFPSPIISNVRKAVGDEKTDQYFPIKSFLAAGVPLLAGSDWPVIAAINPFIGLGTMVTRADPDGKTPGTLAPHEAITVEQAVEIFTVQGARALGKEDQRVRLKWERAPIC